jgi:glucose-1-phosphate cytidylyltransferase
MKTIILAGGLGTRLSEKTNDRPKPMVEIGGKPILWHILNGYSAYGFNEFIIALGYRGDVIKDYFLNFFSLNNDLTVDLSTGEVEVHRGREPEWKIHLIDTGLNTQTGGRLKRLEKWIGNKTFMMTYGDGLADVHIPSLIQFHREHKKLATVTAVRPPARFGGIEFEGDRVRQFSEKPQSGEGWINGGFFVLEPEVLKYIDGDDFAWELQPLDRLAKAGELFSYQHRGFWQPMDTLREQKQLEALWQAGRAPWMIHNPQSANETLSSLLKQSQKDYASILGR